MGRKRALRKAAGRFAKSFEKHPDKSQRNKPAAASEETRLRIRGAGLRATPGRVATYRALLDASAPLTHGEVVERLQALGLDRATVYRNLIDLTDAGLLARSDHGDHAWRFEASASHTRDHVHFVCVDCGDVSCLPGVDVSFVAGRGVPRSVQTREVEVQLRGRCDACS
jgi:Fur family transcriptional regulator, ferric uptake regulator